jgi:integrase
MSNVEDSEKRAAGATAPNQLSRADIKGKIVEYAFWLQKQGIVSAKNRVAMIKRLADLGANLLDPESVKAVIAKQQTWSSSYKMLVTYAYEGFLKMLGMTWQRPKYKQQQALPFIPTEEELNALIVGVGPKLGTFLQGLKDTGADPGELAKLRWIDVNFQNCTVNIRPVKGHNPRILKFQKSS